MIHMRLTYGEIHVDLGVSGDEPIEKIPVLYRGRMTPREIHIRWRGNDVEALVMLVEEPEAVMYSGRLSDSGELLALVQKPAASGPAYGGTPKPRSAPVWMLLAVQNIIESTTEMQGWGFDQHPVEVIADPNPGMTLTMLPFDSDHVVEVNE